jgi:hypothetical protein
MEKARQAVRFYQMMSAKPFLVMLYRIKDVWDNKRTLSVIFEVKGLEIKMRYQLYSSWTNKGLPYSISNLSNRNRLPEPKPIFITEDVEDRILEMGDECRYDFINYHFDNVLDRLKTVLKDERFSHSELVD